MRTKKAIITTALAVPMLALGGGIAYATTTAGSPPPATRTAVTTTVQPTHPAGQANRNGHRYDHRCDWRGHGYQQPATTRQATGQQATRHSGQLHGDQGQNHRGYQGNGGQYRSGSQWGSRSGCCGDWH